MNTDTTPAVVDNAIVPDVISNKQVEACLAIVAQVKRLTGRMLKDYWSVGKLIENIIQALANCIIVEAILRVQPYLKEIGGWFVLQVHDELVFLVPETDAATHAAELARLIITNPQWCLDLPIACGKPGIAKEYSK